MTVLLRYLILPPGIFLLSLSLVLVLWHRKPRWARSILALTIVALYLLSTMPVAVALNRWTQGVPALDPAQAEGCQAVVVLGGGVRQNAPHRGGQVESADGSLARVDYAAELAHRYDLPVLACGGTDPHVHDTEAFAMAHDLQDLGVKTIWMEAKSTNTIENAQFGKQVLEQYGVTKILLVTSAGHMTRASRAFQAQGLEVVQAPMHFDTRPLFHEGIYAVLPRASNFANSCAALQTVLGAIWYELRYY